MADASQVRLARGSIVDARVNADGDRLVQVLVNILSNAVKFSSAGSAVTVSCARAGEAVEVRVTDTGRGIPASHIGSLFQRFQQVESSDARDPTLRALPLLIYTGRALNQEQRLRLRLGTTHFLTKSRASEEQFVSLVRELLAGRGGSA
jgi:signal transduction histidine kinase